MGAGGEPELLAPPSAARPPLSAPISANIGEVSAGPAPKPAFADSAAPATLEQIVPAVDVDDPSDDEVTKRQKCRSETWSVVKLFLTNSALVGLVAGYCALGGLIFNQLEAPNEINECQAKRKIYRAALDRAVKKVDFLSTNLQLSDEERSQMYSDTMDQLRMDFQDSAWDTRNCDTMIPAWNWMGAFFFCLTVLSTIGYGQIAPRTMWGRVIVMFYAIGGLPLMVMALASVGNVLAHMFKWGYNMLCCCGCCIRHRKARVRIKPPAIMWRVNADGKPVGDGPSVLVEDSDSELEDEAEVNIPLTVSLLVIAVSLLMGAIIFSTYEGWSFLDAAYYSFVSLATIGFGDLVPDFSDANNIRTQGKMIVTWIFLVFGMALVSMCLQMMQNEVAQKVKWLTTKFNLDKAKKAKEVKDREEQLKADRKAREADIGHHKEKDEEKSDESDDEGNGKIKLTRIVKSASGRPKTGSAPKSARPRTGVTSASVRPRTGATSARPVSGRASVAPFDEGVKAGYYQQTFDDEPHEHAYQDGGDEPQERVKSGYGGNNEQRVSSGYRGGSAYQGNRGGSAYPAQNNAGYQE